MVLWLITTAKGGSGGVSHIQARLASVPMGYTPSRVITARWKLRNMTWLDVTAAQAPQMSPEGKVLSVSVNVLAGSKDAAGSPARMGWAQPVQTASAPRWGSPIGGADAVCTCCAKPI